LSDHDFKQYDFEHPSILFILEDKLRTLFGGPVLYNAYFNTFGLKGNECKSGHIRELQIPDSSFDVISVIHAIHDIAPEDGQDIVKTLSLTLKAGGFFFIREPAKRSHGLPAEQIRSLLSGAGLGEIAHEESKSEYTAKHQKYG